MSQKTVIVHALLWGLLLLSLICLFAGFFWMAWSLYFPEDTEFSPIHAFPLFLSHGFLENSQSASVAVFLGTSLLVQWLFLRPRREWKPRLAETARPMKTAIAAAAFMALWISCGFLVTLSEIFSPESWGNFLDNISIWGYYSALLGIWALWAVVFYFYWREGERLTRLSRMIGGLLSGTILELFIAIGVYAWNRHDEDCWCARGSFAGLIFGATVMIWAFGPGLILLFIKRQRIKGSE